MKWALAGEAGRVWGAQEEGVKRRKDHGTEYLVLPLLGRFEHLPITQRHAFPCFITYFKKKKKRIHLREGKWNSTHF